MEKVERKCPSCKGTNLAYGSTSALPLTFAPDGEKMLAGYPARGFACLDCGFLGHFLDQLDLEVLRKICLEKRGRA